MKKVIICIFICIIGLVVVLANQQNTNQEYLRIHIRANSNLEIDQTVKYKVKDAVVNFLIPYLSTCESKEESILIIEQYSNDIEAVADNVLKTSGFNYTSKLSVVNEKFPTRTYGDVTLNEGFYDALILELGEGVGDNWWCVVYPPLCFLNGTDNKNLVYKSRIWNIINSFFENED
ncbi:MAG: stage II sporulation protein R [Clostridia bacterium]|nr:stage II sporulation protein R [Clostridia bacterium]